MRNVRLPLITPTLFTLIILLAGCQLHKSSQRFPQSSSDDCFATRAAVDMGSGTTKIMLAKVDFCQDRIKKVIWENQVKLSLQQDLQENQRKGLGSVLSEKIQSEGLKVLANFQAEVTKRQQQGDPTPVHWQLMATSTVRKGQNGREFMQKIEKTLNIPTVILSQADEAKLGYFSAISQLPKDFKRDQIVVWDIGGGSMQLTSYTQNENNGPGWIIYYGQLASVSYKELVMEFLQGKDLQKTETPNPLGVKVADKALKLSRFYARLHLPPAFKENLHAKTILGIGGVLYHSVGGQTQTKGKIFSRAGIEKTLAKRIFFNDQQLANDYASTEVTNLTLVLGYMQAMQINEVYNLKTQLLDGLLISPDFFH